MKKYHCWFCDYVGDNKSYSILSSRSENTYSEIISERILKKIKVNYKKYHWLTRGSDERMFNGQGFDLPISSIMRSKYGTYPEYHTSLDNLDLVSPKSFKTVLILQGNNKRNREFSFPNCNT